MTDTAITGKEFHVTVSTAAEEADDVCRIGHDGYVESGFMEPRPSGRRLVPPYLNPGSLFVIARLGSRGVGGGVLIKDGPFGLGTDNAFPDLMADIRSDSSCVFEPSTLTIDPTFRKSGRRLMTILLSTLARLFSESGPGGSMVLSVSPSDVRFWNSAFGFEPVTTTPRDLWGAPADLLMVDHDTALSHLHGATRRFPRELFQGMVESDPPWLTDARTDEGLDPAWFRPLIGEDPDLTQLRDCLDILEARGSRAPHAETSPSAH